MAFDYLANKKYDDALRISKELVKDTTTKESAICALRVPAYEAKKDYAKLKSAASDCLVIVSAKNPNNKYDAANQIYLEAKMYGYEQDKKNESVKYKEFIKFLEDSNLSQSEEFSNLYNMSKEKVK